jgi:two-component system response regulator EvgA
MISITLIDKFPILRVGIIMYLKQFFSDITIWELDNISELNTAHTPADPDIIIIGINLYPSDSCMDYIHTIIKENPNSRMIIYDEKPDAVLLNDYLKSGVAGYLSKQDELTELTECIKVVMNGNRYVCKELVNEMQEADFFSNKRNHY